MKYRLAMLLNVLALATSAQTVAYRVETVATGLEHPWALAFLPDGGRRVTERPGRLHLIERGADGRLQLRRAPVAGVPAVLASGQAGLFDILLDPDFATNRRLFQSFAHGTQEANHLRVVSARFDGRKLQGIRPVFTSKPAKSDTQHFGGRMAWLPDGSMLFGMGDGNLERTDAQRLHTHLGKFMRIHADGRVPADNPFVSREGARPEIYSTGHRNPQGVIVVNGLPYAHEHGSRGRDELNRLAPGANFGWPITTGGVDYTYANITPYRNLPDITAPLTE